VLHAPEADESHHTLPTYDKEKGKLTMPLLSEEFKSRKERKLHKSSRRIAILST